jgi:hypothetical protein
MQDFTYPSGPHRFVRQVEAAVAEALMLYLQGHPALSAKPNNPTAVN